MRRKEGIEMRKTLHLLLLLAAASISMHRAQAQVVVIASPNVKPADVSKNELRDLFTGAASSFKDGSHVTPVLLKGGSANDEFLAEYVGKNDGAFKAGWRSLVFSGQASMPKTVESEAAMVEYVAHNPGAIGYIGKATPHEGVKVLEVR
jgi:ABC-type phosphate transport system substrate-binding protein